jgi:hypothetical protein
MTCFLFFFSSFNVSHSNSILPMWEQQVCTDLSKWIVSELMGVPIVLLLIWDYFHFSSSSCSSSFVLSLVGGAHGRTPVSCWRRSCPGVSAGVFVFSSARLGVGGGWRHAIGPKGRRYQRGCAGSVCSTHACMQEQRRLHVVMVGGGGGMACMLRCGLELYGSTPLHVFSPEEATGAAWDACWRLHGLGWAASRGSAPSLEASFAFWRLEVYTGYSLARL